ncbi:carboxylating nicotinate-nucleotide diphosphorylase [Acetivibrio mesophilus]|uniref:Probable nicotinate-nucleotide pyrophosphorylase [carboxylating] n=1 Tax=Acetivibrio mesophilus TaxID=2487273 RepID=A0A4V1K1U3_9FIRM|nr:carboxylating nicotinate-nucleotide diphosphorylase [Acetivibrio mesophilus]ODM27132.1 nicotinate-nucleotide diphosphorylase (carboxylating) [Clostridium sp. Bc-iso-3]RXE57989.1 carboxylating nicotinate-nucleotide diphosphorylase [Acetivibrio mesophilus]HHV30677.1 carboxylating nicotinate-nucleotide diphosphorylase [Clostridium sp.]
MQYISDIDRIIINALKEDIPSGDITTESIIDEASESEALLISKDEGVIAGLDVAKKVFLMLDEKVIFEKKVEDGQIVKRGDIIAKIKGNTIALLKGERTALNLLQRLSGIATKTRYLADKIKDLPAKLVDTRKTTPGLRILEKYAVRVGGGYNHRFCLSDGVLIKDNHIKAAGGIKQAIELVRERIPHTMKIEVETESIEEVLEALDGKADIIMLDNMGLDKLEEAVKIINGRAITEASGNVNADTIYDIACTGVDIISVGGLTHSVNAFDISMKIS